MFSHDQYNRLVEATVNQIKRLSELKGGEYSGDHDRLANFRRNGLSADLPMETIWRIYAAKHWDAIMQYELDTRQGKSRERLEDISGRADDLIVYLVLFKAMVMERHGYKPKMKPIIEESEGEELQPHTQTRPRHPGKGPLSHDEERLVPRPEI